MGAVIALAYAYVNWHSTSCWHMYVLLACLTSSWRGCIIVVLFATHPTLGDNNPAAAGSIAMELHRFRLKVCLYPASCIWKIYGLLGIHLLIFGKYIYSYRDDFTRLYTTYLLSLLLTKRTHMVYCYVQVLLPHYQLLKCLTQLVATW